MSTTIARVKKSAANVPQTLEQTDRWVGLLGGEQARLDALEATAEEKIRRIRESLRKESEPVRKRRNNLMTGIFTFASANKARLIDDDHKSVELTNGTLSWRWTPPAGSGWRGPRRPRPSTRTSRSRSCSASG